MTTARRTGTRKRKVPEDEQLSLDRIVESALELIDSDGLEKFSLRNLAARLGVYPTAIYWYVDNRNALLALVVAAALKDVRPKRQRREWQKYVRDLFGNFRAAIRAHPNIAPLIGTQTVSNANMDLELIEQILAVFSKAGLTGARLLGAYNTVIAAMVGFVAQEFAPLPTEGTIRWQDEVRNRLLSVHESNQPTVARNLPMLSNQAFLMRWQNGVEAPLDISFELYIDVIVSGIERLISASREP